MKVSDSDLGSNTSSLSDFPNANDEEEKSKDSKSIDDEDLTIGVDLSETKVEDKPKALSWSAEKVQEWFNQTMELSKYSSLFTDNDIKG